MIKTQSLLLPFLILIVILPRLATDLYLPSLPNIILDLSTSVESVQMTMNIFMLGYAFSMLISGPLSDIYGRKKIMILGLVLFLISTIICAICNSIEILIFARFFQALGGCCGTVIARVMVRDGYKKDEQIKILAHLSTAMAICPLVTPFMGGLITLYFGWRYVFILLVLIGLLVLIFSGVQLKESGLKKQYLFGNLLKNYKILLTSHLFWGYSLTIGLVWSCYFAFTIESPFLFQKALGLNSVEFGILFSIVVLGYVFGAQLSRNYANKVGLDKLIYIAILLCLASAILLISLISLVKLNWIIIVLPMILLMTGVGIIIPCSQAAVMQPFPQMAGTASGLFFFIQMLFGLISGLIIQLVKANNPAMVMAMVILFSTILLYFSFSFLIWSKLGRRFK